MQRPGTEAHGTAISTCDANGFTIWMARSSQQKNATLHQMNEIVL
jgi:hypothetical protein